ncbi:zinc-binding dehydrogenase [Neobacillus niacini]|jgi:2-desacetyl-2-hydroxyethyl bacteriochlorophyllide A dehydrogenase|uniref:zinc-dependent alcohol dehydrogenase n=1 Tax=Neobacillus niacini TaxID=86668 RepID=UPI001C8E7862|nr:alcohol dehydrogenase catalytic domain-containing protein [Neobacillus niacini]MBY0149135.1 alcohol dehydrogenase catalytic domain-containing protein [Neobacillus niacini]
MKAAIFKEARKLEVTEIPVPKPTEDEILIKVDYCGICGSDLHTYTKGLYVNPGQIMGHEFAGVVKEIGANVSGLTIDQKVVIRPLIECGSCQHCLAGMPHLCANGLVDGIGYGRPGAFAEYIIVPKPLVNKVVFPLPDNVSTKEAALIEPLAVAVHGVKLANVDLADKVVVFGAGTIGLFVAQVLKTIGNCHVTQIDISNKRLELAKELGVDVVINAQEENVMERLVEITGAGNYGAGASVDVVFECAGVPITVNQSLEAVRHGGKIISLALFEENVSLDPTILVQKEISWKGSFAYNTEFKTAIDLLSSGKVNAEALISHLYPIDEVTAAFEKQLKANESVKVCFEF